MYCSECGTKNDPYALYCVQDGYPLQQPQLVGGLHIQNDLFCGECGVQRHHSDRYCTECGSSFDTYDSSKWVSEFEHTYFNADLGKKVLPGFILSAAVLFLLNQIFSLYVKSGAGQLNGLLFGLGLPNAEKLSILDYVLFSNLTTISMNIDQEEFSNQVTYLSSGMIYPILLAVISLVAGGFLIKYLYPRIEEWKAAVVFAGGYGLFLGALSLAGGMDMVEDGMARYSFHFSTGSALVNGIIIGFFFSYAGMALKRGVLAQKIYVFAYQRALYYATYTFIAGYGILLLITAFLNTQYEPETQMNFENPEKPWYTEVAFVTKLAVYFFNLILFNTFTAKDLPSDSESINYSFFSGGSNKSMDGLQYLLPPEMFESYEIVPVVMMAVIFLFVGRLLGKSQQHIAKTVIIYSLAFAVLFTFFTFHASTNYQSQAEQLPDGELNVNIGFGIVRTFIISTLYAGVTGFIGAKSRKLF